MDNDPFRNIFIKYLILQIKKGSDICVIYSAKVSDLLHCLRSLAIKTLKADLACPVTGLSVHVLKSPSQRYAWRCWMDFACTGQACYGWMVPQMDSLMLPGAAGLTVHESCNVSLYLQPGVCWFRSLKQLEQFASAILFFPKSFCSISEQKAWCGLGTWINHFSRVQTACVCRLSTSALVHLQSNSCLVLLRACWCQCAYSCMPHLDSWESIKNRLYSSLLPLEVKLIQNQKVYEYLDQYINCVFIGIV